MKIPHFCKRFRYPQSVLVEMTRETISPLFMRTVTIVPLAASLLLCGLPYVSYADEEGTPSLASSCPGESDDEAGITAYELGWSAKLALGSKMLFSPGSFRDAATSSFRNAAVVNAYRPDVWRETENLSEEELKQWSDTWYAIVNLEGDKIPWYKSPPYAAYQVPHSDIEKLISDSGYQNCNIDFLGYRANLDVSLGESLEVNASEFILLPGYAE